MSIIKMILGLLFQKDCGRKIKRPKVKRWYPLIGTTECDNVHDALVGSPYDKKIDDAYNKKSGLQGGSFIDNLFSEINPYLQETVQHLNGAKEINDATLAKRRRLSLDLVVSPRFRTHMVTSTLTSRITRLKSLLRTNVKLSKATMS